MLTNDIVGFEQTGLDIPLYVDLYDQGPVVQS